MNKKLCITLFLSVWLSISFANENKYAIFSLSVSEKVKSESIDIVNENKESRTLKLIDKQLVDTIKVSEKGAYFKVLVGAKGYPLFLKEGFTVALHIENQQPDSMYYKGKGAAENNFMLEKMKLLAPIYKGIDFLAEADAYSKQLTEVKDKSIEAIEAYFKGKDADSSFVAYQKATEVFKHANLMSMYVNMQQEQGKKIPKDFYKFTEKLDLNDEALFTIRANQNFQYYYYQHLIDSSLNDTLHTLALLDTIHQKAKHPTIQNHLLHAVVKANLATHPQPKKVYESFKKLSTSEKDKEAITQLYNKVKKLMPGNKAPDFTDFASSEEGKTYSLSDFKGKYVYLKIWGSWCPYSKAEIPYFKKIQEQYKDDNIEFVSISMDTDEKKWKKYVTQMKLEGIQLRADKGLESIFASDYLLKGVPRFVLIDPEGQLISSVAPNPSDPSLLQLLEVTKKTDLQEVKDLVKEKGD